MCGGYCRRVGTPRARSAARDDEGRRVQRRCPRGGAPGEAPPWAAPLGAPRGAVLGRGADRRVERLRVAINMLNVLQRSPPPMLPVGEWDGGFESCLSNVKGILHALNGVKCQFLPVTALERWPTFGSLRSLEHANMGLR